VTSFDCLSIFYVLERETETDKNWGAYMSTTGVLVSIYPIFCTRNTTVKIQ